MKYQHQSPDENADDVDSYEQVQRLFMAAVQLPPADRISWVESQPDLHPQVVAARKADATFYEDSDEPASDDPATAATVYGNQGKTQQGGSRGFSPNPQLRNH